MRLPLLPILVLLVLGVLLDIYIWRRNGRTCRNTILRKVLKYNGWVFAALLLAIVAIPKKTTSDSTIILLMWSIYAYLSVYIPKALYTLCALIGDIPRLWHHRPLRRVAKAGAVLAFFVFISMWWGALVGRYRIDVKEVTVEIPTLPHSFHGLRIVQLSDMHVGSFGTDTTFVSRVVDNVNALRPDMILFTGDVVNRHSPELEPFVPVLSRLRAPLGVYSVLGNHDYGDYYQWPDSTAKAQNLQLLRDLQARMGWRLLSNQHTLIYKGSDSLAVIGVENIGDPPFAVYGDLDAAYPALDDGVVKILMTHNPAHWCGDICGAPDKNIALTLSGHTHAMQCELLGWSPAALRYKTWGGKYSDNDGHTLYVNIGMGEVGMPARIGASPEITLITLK